MKKIYIQILIVLACIPISGTAQVFPVNSTPQVIPPYSLKLSEYSTATVSEKLLLTLLLTDITESNRQVRLKLFIENNAGLAIQSSEVVIGANPIYLDGGIPTRLSNIDLQAYFSLQNLQGITPQQYSQPLPEGLYRFCFEVYDALSGRQISRKSCATVYLVLNDPPFLNIPNRGEQVLLRDPQNIIFQWTPRHLNATNVSYEFTLAELWDIQMDPQAAFLASRPLYQTTTFATTLLYGPGETSLLPDKTYGWRVRAMISDGISESSVFKNDGYSEIYYFTYTGSCAEPAFVLAEAKSPTNEKILWQGVDHRRYNVQYRKKDAENSIWFDSPTVNTYTTIYNLEPGTSYEFRVGGQCLDNGPFTYSQIYEFTTTIAADQESTYNCGITPEIVIHNQDPLETMVINETFTAGDFPVTVKEVNGNNGSFSGWGYIVVPYLQDTKIKVSFDNIRINTEYQLLEGIVVTDYDENWGGVDDIGNEIDALLSLGDAILQITAIAITTSVEKINELANKIKEFIYKDENITEEEVALLEEKLETLVEAKKTYDTATTDEEKEAAEEIFEEAQEEIVEDIDIPDTNDTDEEGEEENFIAKIWFAGDNTKYANGETVEVGYDAEDLPLAFSLKNYPDSTQTFKWQLFHSGMDKTVEVQSNEPNLDNFGLNLKGRRGDIKLKVTYDDKAIEVILIAEKEEFDLVELTATDKAKPKRIAKSGEKLYLLQDKNEKEVVYNLELSRDITATTLSSQDVKWFYEVPNQQTSLGRDYGKSSITRRLSDTPTISNTKVEAGYPNLHQKDVDVEWFDREYNKKALTIGSSSNDLIKKALEIKDLTEEYSKKLDKIPFIKRVKKDQVESGIGFYLDVIPFQQTTENFEDLNSRLYYTKKETEGGFEAGLNGSFKNTIWGVPYEKLPLPDWAIEKAREYFVLEIYLFGEAKAGGDFKAKIIEKKFVEKSEWETVSKGVDPALLKLNMSFGIGAEAKILKENEYFSVGAEAKGTANAEIMSLGWVGGNDFDIYFLREGVYLEARAELYLTFLGKKLQMEPFYKRITIIDPPLN